MPLARTSIFNLHDDRFAISQVEAADPGSISLAMAAISLPAAAIDLILEGNLQRIECRQRYHWIGFENYAGMFAGQGGNRDAEIVSVWVTDGVTVTVVPDAGCAASFTL